MIGAQQRPPHVLLTRVVRKRRDRAFNEDGRMKKGWGIVLLALALAAGCATYPTRSATQMGAMLYSGDAYPIAPFRYMGTADGYHYFNHLWKRKTHFYSEAFKVPVVEIPVGNQFQFGTARLQWRDYAAYCDEAGKIIALVEW